jgi:hypothetical protein
MVQRLGLWQDMDGIQSQWMIPALPELDGCNHVRFGVHVVLPLDFRIYCHASTDHHGDKDFRAVTQFIGHCDDGKHHQVHSPEDRRGVGQQNLNPNHSQIQRAFRWAFWFRVGSSLRSCAFLDRSSSHLQLFRPRAL